MKWLLWLLLLLPITLHGGGETLEGAAVKAFQLIQTLPGHAFWEYGGVIVIKDGRYYYSAFPTTNSKGDRVLVDVKMMAGGNKLVGIYHTHPCVEDYWTELYSPNDLIQQMFFKVPSFILDQCKMEVHEIDLAVDNAHDTGRDVHTADGKRLIHLPAGRIVGHL
jgi:hypothetical protein